MKPLSLEIHGAKFVKTPKTKSGCVEKQELELDHLWSQCGPFLLGFGLHF